MRNAETKGYVTWRDVMTVWRYLEAGYNIKIQSVMDVKCPVGEQYDLCFTQLIASEVTGETVPLPRRITKKFPNHAAKTYPGVLLGLLYELDSALGEVRVFVESKHAVKPRAGLAA